MKGTENCKINPFDYLKDLEWRTTFARIWRMFQNGDESGVGARLDSSRGDFTLQIRAVRISLHRYNVACLSLTPHLSGVWAVVSGSEPLQRFTRRRKPLKRLGSLFACHTHLAEARC